MRQPRARRAATVGGLFAALFVVRFLVDRPTFLGVTFLLVLPVVLAALWFGTPGALAMALAAALCFYVAERVDPSVDVESHTVLVAALVRAVGLAVAGVLVAELFARQVAITRELDELEATRDALRPSAIAPRPALDLAAHYVPVQDGVGGDFYLAVEGPRGSTVLVVGDVVGKGVTGGAASRVRADVARDLRPVRGRPRAAAAAGQRGADRPRRHLRGLRDGGLRRPPPGGRDARLGAGRPSRAARARTRAASSIRAAPGQPLGLDHELEVALRASPLTGQDGVLLYTDGILDARDAARRCASGRSG